MRGKTLTLTAALLVAQVSLAAEQKLEVLHMWTSGGEAEAISVLKDGFTRKGYSWKDLPATNTQTLNQVLRSRVASRAAPGAVALHSQEIAPWVEESLLLDLDPVAKQQNWDTVMSSAIVPFIKQDGAYYAVPTQMHRANWLWYNKAVFSKYNLQPPTTLDEFKVVADKLLQAGVVPLAIGGQNWQEATLFESTLLAVAGADFYKKAILERDATALQSATMVKVFDEFRGLKKYIDPNYPGRDWNLATQMVMNGTAAMQIVGDYAKGEFQHANLKADVDYGCVPAPGTAGTYLSLVDTFGFFKSANPQVQAAQLALADVIMDKDTQLAFSLKKGSIPARLDVDVSSLDACGQKAFADRAEAEMHQRTYPSVGHFEAWPPAQSGIFMDVVSTFFEQDSVTAQQAVSQLAEGLASLDE